MALTVEIVGPNMAQQNMGACLLFSSMGGTVMLMVDGAVASASTPAHSCSS